MGPCGKVPFMGPPIMGWEPLTGGMGGRAPVPLTCGMEPLKGGIGMQGLGGGGACGISTAASERRRQGVSMDRVGRGKAPLTGRRWR